PQNPGVRQISSLGMQLGSFVLSGVKTQPDAGSHVSSVQTSLSSHVIGALPQPLAGSPVSVVHASFSLRLIAECLHPRTGSQLSSVQASLSSQLRGGPEVQSPVVGSQLSGPLHALLSEGQTTGAFTQVSEFSSQESVVHRLLSSQECGTLEQTPSLQLSSVQKRLSL